MGVEAGGVWFGISRYMLSKNLKTCATHIITTVYPPPRKYVNDIFKSVQKLYIQRHIWKATNAETGWTPQILASPSNMKNAVEKLIYVVQCNGLPQGWTWGWGIPRTPPK